ECRHHAVCEVFPRRLPSELASAVDSNVKRIDHLLDGLEAFTTSATDHNGFAYVWQRLVEVYSQCQMTNEEDKLIAINGIVDAIKTRTGYQCLAGLWRPILPLDLLWCVRNGSQGDG